MKKALKKILCIGLAASMLLSSGAAMAVTQEEIDALEAQRGELQSQKENIQEQLDALSESRENMLERKSALDEQSELLRQEIILINGEIALYDGIIAEKAENAEKAKADEDAHYALYCSRVRDMEEYSAWNYLSYVFGADSISDLIARFTDISDIMDQDKKLREDYIKAREYAEETLAEYEAVQAAQKEKRAELEASEAELEEKIAESAAMIEAMEADIDTYMAFQDAVDGEMAEVQELIDQKAEELRKQKEAEEAAKNQVPTPPASGTVSSGYYMWPSNTTYVTSPFGPRVHPIYGQLKPHTGVDIGAWYGSEIYAAASGTVSLAVVDYSSVGYGTYVAIYHPNGTTTLYAHMSSLAVYAGQTVTQGQVIGYVGSTGASNGPHIHFEIRQNGVCVDPMLYF